MKRAALAALLFLSLGACQSQEYLRVEKVKVLQSGAHFMKAASAADMDSDGFIGGVEWLKLLKDFYAALREANATPDAQ